MAHRYDFVINAAVTLHSAVWPQLLLTLFAYLMRVRRINVRESGMSTARNATDRDKDCEVSCINYTVNYPLRGKPSADELGEVLHPRVPGYRG
jgi:hypothetical protein